MMNDSIFQKIYDLVDPICPKDYSKLIIYMEYGVASYSFAFYVLKENKYVKCYDWEDVTEDLLWNVFSKIDKIVAPERKKVEGECWSNMTLVIDEQGSFKADYDYTNLEDCSYEHKKKWKAKYLK